MIIAYVHAENIRRFEALLAKELDPSVRAILSRLLAAERADDDLAFSTYERSRRADGALQTEPFEPPADAPSPAASGRQQQSPQPESKGDAIVSADTCAGPRTNEHSPAELDGMLTALVSELWDRNFSQSEIRHACLHAMSDLQRHAHGVNRRAP